MRPRKFSERHFVKTFTDENKTRDHIKQQIPFTFLFFSVDQASKELQSHENFISIYFLKPWASKFRIHFNEINRDKQECV